MNWVSESFSCSQSLLSATKSDRLSKRQICPSFSSDRLYFCVNSSDRIPLRRSVRKSLAPYLVMAPPPGRFDNFHGMPISPFVLLDEEMCQKVARSRGQEICDPRQDRRIHNSNEPWGLANGRSPPYDTSLLSNDEESGKPFFTQRRLLQSYCLKTFLVPLHSDCIVRGIL